MCTVVRESLTSLNCHAYESVTNVNHYFQDYEKSVVALNFLVDEIVTTLNYLVEKSVTTNNYFPYPRKREYNRSIGNIVHDGSKLSSWVHRP